MKMLCVLAVLTFSLNSFANAAAKQRKPAGLPCSEAAVKAGFLYIVNNESSLLGRTIRSTDVNIKELNGNYVGHFELAPAQDGNAAGIDVRDISVGFKKGTCEAASVDAVTRYPKN